MSTLADERDAISAAWRRGFGQSMDLGDRTAEGFIIAAQAERVALAWEGVESAYNAQDPDKATGAALDALCLVTGTVRLTAQASRATLTLTGTPTTDIAAGQLVATRSTGRQFSTLDATTLTAATARAISTAYTLGAIRTNASRIYVVTVAGTSGTGGGPTTTATAITDGTVTWRYVGEGTGYAETVAIATETGPVVAVSGDLTRIDTFIGGWQSVINLLDAELGRDRETDAELRARRQIELAQPGTSTRSAIRTALLQVTGVTSVRVFGNRTDVTNSDGMPPHSVEPLPTGGDDDAIRVAIAANIADGVASHGTVSGTVVDSEGVAEVVKFSRPTEKLVYATLTLTYDAATFPADGPDAVKLAVATRGNALGGGRDVVASAVASWAFGVSGVLDVSSVLISVAPTTTPVSSATIPISLRELSRYDTSRIIVNATPATP